MRDKKAKLITVPPAALVPGDASPWYDVLGWPERRGSHIVVRVQYRDGGIGERAWTYLDAHDPVVPIVRPPAG